MKFEQVCQSALAYFQQHPVFKILLPISMPVMLVCVVLSLLQNLISLGGFVSALDYLLAFLVSLIRYHSLSYGALVYLVVYGGLAFLSYRKSMTFN